MSAVPIPQEILASLYFHYLFPIEKPYLYVPNKSLLVAQSAGVLGVLCTSANVHTAGLSSPKPDGLVNTVCGSAVFCIITEGSELK